MAKKQGFKEVIRQKSAWVPFVMSGLALLEILIYVAIYGFRIEPQQGNEYLPAHIFQMLLGFQIPIIAYFAIKNFLKNPREVIQIVMLQFIAGYIPFYIVSLLETNK